MMTNKKIPGITPKVKNIIIFLLFCFVLSSLYHFCFREFTCHFISFTCFILCLAFLVFFRRYLFLFFFRWLPSSKNRRSLPQSIPCRAQVGLGPFLYRLALLGLGVSYYFTILDDNLFICLIIVMLSVPSLKSSWLVPFFVQGETVCGAQGGQKRVALHGDGAG